MNSKPAWAIKGRTGPVRKFLDMTIFACEGLICVIDERPGKEGEATVVTPTDMERRVVAVMRQHKNQKSASADMPRWQRQELAQKQAGANGVLACIKEARDMGDPSDPAVQEFWRRHRRSNTVKLSVSPGSDPKGYPDLPIVPVGKRTGKTAAIDHEAVVPPNVHSSEFPKIHKRPRKKNRAGLILDLDIE